MDDVFLRELLIWLFALSALAFIVGGFFTRASGIFEEENRQITLHQLGPWVWGHCSFDSGRQAYTGFATLGRVRLVRRDFGVAHLVALGFSRDHAAALEGQSTGVLRFRTDAHGLSGEFWGYRFRQEGAQMRARGFGSAQARRWKRVP